jgi:hypothetical protein
MKDIFSAASLSTPARTTDDNENDSVRRGIITPDEGRIVVDENSKLSPPLSPTPLLSVEHLPHTPETPVAPLAVLETNPVSVVDKRRFFHPNQTKKEVKNVGKLKWRSMVETLFYPLSP